MRICTAFIKTEEKSANGWYDEKAAIFRFPKTSGYTGYSWKEVSENSKLASGETFPFPKER